MAIASTPERHQVQRATKHLDEEKCPYDAQRQRSGGDQRGAAFAQEPVQNENRQYGADQNRIAHAAYRVANELRQIVNQRNMQSVRDRISEIRDQAANVRADLQDVGPDLTRNIDQRSRLAVAGDENGAIFDSVAHFRDVTQVNRRGSLRVDHGVANLLERGELPGG